MMILDHLSITARTKHKYCTMYMCTQYQTVDVRITYTAVFISTSFHNNQSVIIIIIIIRKGYTKRQPIFPRQTEGN